MTSQTVLINILRFFLLLFLQVLILNNINLGGYINPFLYIYFILLLPYSISKWLLLLLSFFLGLGIDFFTHTLGLNAASCVLLGFSRPFIIKFISSGPDTLIGECPSLKNQGIKWFFYYTLILVLIHHTFLFYLEIFRFNEFFKTLLRVLLSSAFTIFLIFLGEYLFSTEKK